MNTSYRGNLGVQMETHRAKTEKGGSTFQNALKHAMKETLDMLRGGKK